MPQETTDLAALTYDDVDRLVDEDPIKLRDVAWAALRSLRANEGHEDARLSNAEATVEKLRDELAAIRDIAYRANGSGSADALEAIRTRAARSIADKES